MTRTPRVLAVAAVGLATLCLAWWLGVRAGRAGDHHRGQNSATGSTSAPGSSDGPPGGSPGDRAARGRPANTTGLDHHALSPSLAGTDVDGELVADEHGNLVLSLGVRDFFDYFLSVVGEVPLAEVKAFMEAYARERLPARAVNQLMALLDDYLAYRDHAAAMLEQSLAPRAEQTPEYHLEVLDQTFKKLEAARRQHMSDDAVQAFFALEEEYGRYTLDRMAIEIDGDLSAAARAEMLADLRAGLSPGLNASESQKVADAAQAQRTREIMAADMDDESRRAALGAYLDDEQVERILARSVAQRDFRARLDRYLAERAAILARDLSAAEASAQIDALRRAHFSDPQELIWARTYEARADRRGAD